jgi:MGT family glycosyltransferase
MSGRVLVVSWNGGGNFPPALALAARLVEAGREVAVMADAAPASSSSFERVAGVGAKLLEYLSLEPWPNGLSLEEDPGRFDEIRNGVTVAGDVLAAAEEFKPDALVVDCMTGAGLVAAEHLGIPTAVLVHVLYQPFVCYWADISVDASRCREALGMERLEAPAMAEQLRRMAKVLVLVPEAFDYPDAPRTPETHYVGPILDPKVPELPAGLGFDPADDRPLVLVSLSTTPQHQKEALPPILEALGNLSVRGLLTLGGVEAGKQAVPDNVVVHDYLPHRGLLGQVSAVVSHAGLSTVMAALAEGVPLVCIPQGREQPLNAERVAACGAGINLPIDASAEAISEAVSAVVADPAYGDGAMAMQGLIERQGSGVSATRHVEALLEG